MNRTHLEHAVVALLMACLGLLLIWLVGPLAAALIMACLYPTISFYFREQGQRTVHLCAGGPITWRITLEACKFWRWSADAILDFVATIPSLVFLFIVASALCK